MLTVQILTKNNEKTIEECLNSIEALNANVLICDLGSKDKTIEICKNFKYSIIYNNDLANFARTRNQIINNEWNFVLEAWETLQYGHQEILNLINDKPAAYRCSIFDSGTITKETRLWHGSLNLKFINPVFETLEDHDSTMTNVTIFSNEESKFDKLELVNLWKQKAPNQSQPYYYYAMLLLTDNKYNDFLSAATYYLHKESDNTQSTTMLQYYCAIVLCHVKKNAYLATQHILNCIANNILMAEFWCLLGDIHYKLLNDYTKAKKFYDNAIVLGSQRLRDDTWPMDIDKYKKYPLKQIENCNELIKNRTILVSKQHPTH